MMNRTTMMRGRHFAACALLPCIAAASGADKKSDPLAFDPGSFTTIHVTVDGSPMELRRYRVVYVANPIRMDITKSPGGPGGPGGPNGPSGGAPAGQAAPPGGAAPGPMGQSAVTDPLAYQSMYIYVPQSAYNDSKAAIILQVNNGGWMASPVQDTIQEGAKLSGVSNTDKTGAALKAGYVVVSAGTRSRGIRSEDGAWAGKAPAVVVDAKAAIRYLRYNDAVMAGSAERIVITGGSGGGGLSVAVAASGNSADYYPYLAEVGAAGIDAGGKSTVRDDVFATIAYCPINDLGNSDIAYEWQYSGVRTAANTSGGQYSDEMRNASQILARQYPAFLKKLNLKREDGSLLNADNLPKSIVELVRRSAQTAIARGEKIPQLGEDFVIMQRMGPPPGGTVNTLRIKNEWLSVKAGKVAEINYEKYIRFVAAATAPKSVPAFDVTANTGHSSVGGENTLFGSSKVEYSNFSEYSWNHNEAKGDGSGEDDTGQSWNSYITGPGVELAKQIKMTSPIPYLRDSATAAPYWYVRHGLIDRDTSFAVQTVLYYAIKNRGTVKDLNFGLAWMQGHAGDYDVVEAYEWLAKVLGAAGDPKQPAK